MNVLRPHEYACLLDCSLAGFLSGDMALDTLWQSGGQNNGYRTITVKNLVSRKFLRKRSRTAVVVTEEGRLALEAHRPDHPLLHSVQDNRSKWRVIDNEGQQPNTDFNHAVNDRTARK